MIPWYLGPFDTKLNIIFKNVEIFKILFFPNQTNIVKDNTEFLGIFSFVEMKIFKIN